MNYTLSANGQTVTITSSDDVVIYTSSSLIYGTVQVTAINSCGQESEPASLTIPTSGLYRAGSGIILHRQLV